LKEFKRGRGIENGLLKRIGKVGPLVSIRVGRKRKKSFEKEKTKEGTEKEDKKRMERAATEKCQAIGREIINSKGGGEQ